MQTPGPVPGCHQLAAPRGVHAWLFRGGNAPREKKKQRKVDAAYEVVSFKLDSHLSESDRGGSLLKKKDGQRFV